MKKLNQFFAIIFLFSIFFACTEKGKTYDRPRDIWVFRSVLDEQARMVTVALSKDMWVTYDAKTANLYKAWKGGVNFDGAVYTTVHGPQPKSEGYAYMSDEPAAMRWFIIENGKRSVPELQYRGHKFIEGQVAFQYEFKSKSGQIAKVSEIPEVVKRGRQNGLSRTFSMEAPEGVQVGFATKISSLVNERDLSSTGVFQITSKELINYDLGSVMSISGLQLLDSDEPVKLTAYFHQGFDKLEQGEEEKEEKTEVAAGAALIERSDCHSCHNEQVWTVGPPYIAIARKYNDSEATVKMLSGKIKTGGKGVWGNALMTAHPNLSDDDLAEMVKYILDLDNADGDSDASSWHLGEKTVPIRFEDDITASKVGAGINAYLYLYSGDQPNLDIMRETSPIGAARLSTLHVRSNKDFGKFESRFAVRFKTNLKIKESASYSFRLVSDDGSRMFLAGNEIIDNWGFHGPDPKDGEVYLKAGLHPIEIFYFQGGGGAAISLQWFNKAASQYEVVPESMMQTSAEDYLETIEYVPEGKLVKAIPGDKMWLAGVHPSFDISQARPEGFRPRIGGIDFLSEDEMVVCTWDSLGPVYKISNFRSENPEEIKVEMIASGLAEPLGIKVVNGEIYVLQKQELTKLIDNDKDGIIDEYRTVSDDWKVSANFHEFAFGLVYKEGFFYGALATAILPGGASANPQIPDRGKIIKISESTGEVQFIASGLRTPNGIGIGVDGEIFVCDNQGDWMPASKVNHVREGAWFGSRSVNPEEVKDRIQDEPVVWLPQDEIGNSPSTPLALDLGPYKGQMIHCEVTHGGIKRVFVEKVKGQYQGAVFRFSQGIEAGVNRLAWAPDGSLLAGGIGVSGNWGQIGKLNYGLQRLAFNGNSAFEMLSVKAKTNGFEIEFTEPIKEGQNISAEDFYIERFYFEPTPQYGGPKLGVTELTPKAFYLSEDREKVFFELDGLKEKHLVYFRIKRPFVSASDQELWTTESWYTLTNIPKDDFGFTNDYQTAHNELTASEKKDGWKSLFDGQSTGDFRNFKSESIGKKWTVQNGTLHFVGKGAGDGWQAKDGGDIIITDKEYANYELNLDWKIQEGGNSGIIYNVIENEEYDYVWQTGPEMQILDNIRHPDGQIYMHRAGDLYDMIESKFVTVNPAGEWNRVRLIVNKGKVEQWLNGYKVVEFTIHDDEWKRMIAGSKFSEMSGFGSAKKGHIALQDHGDKVWFRNIKIKEL